MSSTCLTSDCAGYFSGSVGQSFTSSIQMLLTAQCLIGENWPPDATDSLQGLSFDYIIVGAGTAGSVLGGRLSEDPCKKVLVIDAGGDPPFESQILSTPAAMQKTSVDWQYRTQNDGVTCKGMVDGRCNWPRGKMLGGSGSINGNLYVRGHRKNYDDIGAENPGWSYNDALKYFKKSENLTDPNVQNDFILRNYHSYSGPLDVNLFYGTNPVGQSIIDGYEQLSSRVVKDINGPSNVGTVRAQGTIKNGRRASTATAYLVPARDRTNLKIMKNALVSKVTFNNKTATGVVVILANGTNLQISAKSEVIVSGGTINTPQLLMLSGIGPKAHLQSFNIPVISDLPGVGQNLHDHPMVSVLISLNEGAPPVTPMQTALDVAQYISSRTGAYAQNGILDILTFKNSNPWDFINPPNLQFHHLFFNTQAPQFVRYCRLVVSWNDQICSSLIGYNKNSQLVNVLVTLLDPQSRGNISLASTDPKQPPLIFPNYLRSQNDIDTLLHGIRYVESLVNTPSLRALKANIPRVNITECNSKNFQSNDYWICHMRHLLTTVYHPMGTSKMGPRSDGNAVVDSEFRVYGVKNLRVIDASVFPGTISGNTNAATVMAAEKGADIIKKSNGNCA